MARSLDDKIRDVVEELADLAKEGAGSDQYIQQRIVSISRDVDGMLSDYGDEKYNEGYEEGKSRAELSN